MSLINLRKDCDFQKLLPDYPITDFDCGDSDLNDIKKVKELIPHEKSLQTYPALRKTTFRSYSQPNSKKWRI